MLTGVGFNRFRLANTEFVSAMSPEGSTASCFVVNKPADLLANYHKLRDRLRFGRIVHVTEGDAGGAALTSLVAAPELLVSISQTASRPTALEDFAGLRGVERNLRVHYDVVKDDRQRLTAILESEFGGNALDAVIDDVPKELRSTRAAFESLFPELRPDGWYVIEGWSLGRSLFRAVCQRDGLSGADAKKLLESAIAEYGPPIDGIVAEIVALSRSDPDVVSEVVVDKFWIQARRGPAVVTPGSLALGAALRGGSAADS